MKSLVKRALVWLALLGVLGHLLAEKIIQKLRLEAA